MNTLLSNIEAFGLSILIIVTIIYFLALLKKDNSIMDIAYGLIFLLAGVTAYFATGTQNTLGLIILGAVFLWSMRLSGRILKKNIGKGEDERYVNWRKAWMQKGFTYFLIRTYLQINLLQGLIILLVSLPIILSLGVSDTDINQTFLYLGLLVAFIGLTIETIADMQIDAFIKRKKAGTESATLFKEGLFKYSRRPNYFGESLFWWGLAIVVLPLPFGYLGLISPIVITYIVTKVTGPMLENIFLEKYPTEYRQYMHETSYFIPLPPKKTGL